MLQRFGRSKAGVPARGPTPLTALIRLGSLACLLLPAALASGAQMDNFDSGTDAGWTHYEPLADYNAPVEYSFPLVGPGDYGYRMVAAASPNPGSLGPARGGSLRTDVSYSDFSVSVDLLTWDNSHDEALGILARIGDLGLGTTDGYALTKGGGSLDLSRLTSERPTNLTHAQINWDPTHSYRLVFTGVGTILTGAEYDLTDTAALPVTIFYDTAPDADRGLPQYADGYSGLVVFDNSNFPIESPHSADATWDNFVAAAPEPAGLVIVAVAAMAPLLRRRRGTFRATNPTADGARQRQAYARLPAPTPDPARSGRLW